MEVTIHYNRQILYQARLDEAAKGESDMHKDSTIQAKQKKRRARRSPEGNPAA